MKPFLERLLDEAEARMAHDLESRLVPQAGELGTNREQIIREFLQSYLPKRFEVSTGFVFDCDGKISKQLDIIIANSFVSPRFESVGGKRFYPCESVVAVGQVKSSMTSREDFLAVVSNLQSVKELDRSARGRAVDMATKQPIRPLENHLDQIFTFAFVIGKALKAGSAREEMLQVIHQSDCATWPNVIFVRNKYLLTFCCEQGICPNPMDAKGIALQEADGKDSLLMRLYLMLGAALEVTSVGPMPYWEYLQAARSWSAEVIYSPDIEDGQPPLLRSFIR